MTQRRDTAERLGAAWPARVVVAIPDGGFTQAPEEEFGRHGIQVEWHPDPASALIAVGEGDVAAVVASPTVEGVSLGPMVAAITKYAAIPVFVGLSATDNTDEVLVALDAGACALLSLPLQPKDLRAALHRRSATGPRFQERGGILFDPASQEVRMGDVALTLSYQDYRLLELLVTSAPRSVTMPELASALQGEEADPKKAATAVRVAISRLRQRLTRGGLDGNALVRSARGVGYRWVPPTN